MFIDDRHRRSRRSPGRWIALVLGVVLLVVVVVGLLLWWYAGSRLDPMEVTALEEGASGEEVTNVLVVGTDGPPGADASVGGVEAESIVLLQLSPDRARPVAVSFPTELRVSPSEEGPLRLGDVLVESGADELVRTLQDFTGVDLDHYVGVDLDAASRVAEAVGGVEVCPEEAVQDEATNLDLDAGCQGLSPEQARAWVRSGDDFARIHRGVEFLGGAAEQASATSRRLNPLATKHLVDALAATVVTDRDLGLRSLDGLVSTLAEVDAGGVDVRTVPGTIQSLEGEQFVVAAPEQAPGMFDALAEGRDLEEDVGTEAASELGPADVDVLVVNGVGINGLAGEVQTFLEDREFRVVDALNPSDLDPDAEFDPTLEGLTIRHTEGGLPHAEVLRDHLGDVPVELEEVQGDDLPEDADVLLEVGSAWADR